MSGVVVTGYGARTPLGSAKGDLWRAILAGESRFAPIAHFDPDRGREHRCGFVRDADIVPEDPGAPGRWTAIALAAIKDALLDSGLADAREATLVVGTTFMGGEAARRAYAHYREQSDEREDPEACPALFGITLAEALGIEGAAITVGNASASGAVAIGDARDRLLAGECDVVVAVGVDVVSESAFHGLYGLRTLAPEGSRPFHPGRRGIRISEAAGVMVLELAEHARARGARVHAELSGYGASNRASHVARPDPAALARAMRTALDQAGLSASDVGYVNVHGAGTAPGDVAEFEALGAVFGQALPRVAISSSKPSLGHGQGAAGIVEALVALLAVEHRMVPPTAGLTEVDPVMRELDLVREARGSETLNHALSLSCGLGGVNTAVLVSRHGEVAQ